MTYTLGSLLLALIGVILLVQLNHVSEPSERVTEALPPTPTIGEPWSQPPCVEDEPCWDCTTMGNKICGPLLDYEAGYMDGWTDHKQGESFGGDR
mgnify:CR=1 FL=1